MTVLILGLSLFFALHLFSAFRSRSNGIDIKQRWGEAKYMGIYSLLSVIGFVGIVWGYSLAPQTAYVLNGLENGRLLTPWLMAAAMLLLVASQMPMGFIKKLARHPMLIAVVLWSIAHLVDGADRAQLALFGSFLLYSLIDLVVVSRREDTQNSSVTVPHWRNDLLSVLIAAIVYVLLIKGLHEWLFSISTGI